MDIDTLIDVFNKEFRLDDDFIKDIYENDIPDCDVT